MYSDKKNVLQLVALLRAHGVRRAVLCDLECSLSLSTV